MSGIVMNTLYAFSHLILLSRDIKSNNYQSTWLDTAYVISYNLLNNSVVGGSCQYLFQPEKLPLERLFIQGYPARDCFGVRKISRSLVLRVLPCNFPTVDSQSMDTFFVNLRMRHTLGIC